MKETNEYKTHTNTAQAIALTQRSMEGASRVGNTRWADIWGDMLGALMDTAPSGSGFDDGVKLLEPAGRAEKLVFQTSYHHLNEGGYYDGWTKHTITVLPSFCPTGFTIRSVSGANKNQIKDYIVDVFHEWLSERVDRDELLEKILDQRYPGRRNNANES